MHRTLVPFLTALTACVGLATAQRSPVLPRGMDFVEGPLVYTYPFGRQTGAMCLLYDASEIATVPSLILGIHFRPSQITASQTYPSYTKNYQITAYTVPTMAAVMNANPAVNAGSALGTTVFNGALTLPAVTYGTTFPNDFTIDIPFDLLHGGAPYLYDPAVGNLMFVIETTDAVAVPSGSYRIDAVNFSSSQVTGLSANLDTQGCVVGGNSLTLATTASAAIVGGSITQTFNTSAAGAFPLLLSGLSFERQPQDLLVFGMPGCTSWLGAASFLAVFENVGGGSYPNLVWGLPNTMAIEGVALVGQALGIPASGQLSQAVTSNGVGTRIGSNTFPVVHMDMSFRATTTWSKGTAGTFIAVAKLDIIP